MRAGAAGWRMHGVLALLLGVEFGLACALHRGDAELEAAWRGGTTQQRIDALHTLANRGTPDASRMGGEFVETLLADPDDRIKEFAFTDDVVKFSEPELQDRYTRRPSHTNYPHWWRSYFVHHRRVRGGGPVSRRELSWFLESLRGHPPPLAEVEAHIAEVRKLRLRRRHVLGGSGR